MKELSIEEKAKAYDEVLERAREEYEIYKGIKDVYHCEALERIFHKLAESEDEKIRKWLVEEIYKSVNSSINKGFDIDMGGKALAWLEKQGEQKHTAEEVLIKAGLKPYKDGDQWCVLLGDNIQEGICGFGNTIEDALYAFLKDLIASQGEQKPAWSEEDEKYLNIVYSAILSAGVQGIYDYHKVTNNDVRKWLDKSLRPQKQWKPSDEQMLSLARASNRCVSVDDANVLIKLLEQLKAL